MNYKITYGKNVYGSDEIKAVNQCISKTTQMGKYVLSFEKKISKLTNKKFTVMANSGSSACLLLSEILNLKKGDEFIVPAVNFPTAIVPFIKKGLIPRVIDIDLENLQIDIKKIKQNITKKTKFALIPNLIGYIPRWDLIRKAVGKKFILVEDSADTMGPKINNKLTGNYTNYTISSFYGSHVINCAGNGGALSLNDKHEYKRSSIIRSWGRLSSVINENNLKERFNYKINNKIYDKKFVFTELGYNLEPSEIGSAFGLVQLQKLKKNISIRVKNYKLLENYFKNYSQYFYYIKNDKQINTALLAFPVVVKKNAPFNRFQLQLYLEKSKIQTRPIFSGNFLKQPAFKKILFKSLEKKFPNADHLTDNGLMFGLHHGLKPKDISFIIKKLDFFLKKFL
jgi:CDP-6-deoxy-D-xylo-4-hexulose-3-dehydrase